MTTIRTDLGNLRESAERIRFAPVGVLTATSVQKVIEQLYTLPPAQNPTIVTSATYDVAETDTLLLINRAGAVTINLPLAADKGNLPVMIKDISGNASANNITIVPNGAETIDGLASLVIVADYGGFELGPQTGGWFIRA